MNHYLETLQSELSRAVDGLEERQTQLHPANDSSRWSIQEIVGHLRLTYLATISAMDARIAKRSPTKAKPSPIQYAGQFTLIRLGYFPRNRQAPERVTPAKDEVAAAGDVLRMELEANLKLMDQRIAIAGALFGDRRRVISHMVLGPLSVDQWRKFHLIHGRHHIRQIMAIRREHSV